MGPIAVAVLGAGRGDLCVEHCDPTLLESPEGKDRGTSDPGYLLGDPLPPSLPETFFKAWPDAFQFVNSFLFNDTCFLIQTFGVEFKNPLFLINGL